MLVYLLFFLLPNQELLPGGYCERALTALQNHLESQIVAFNAGQHADFRYLLPPLNHFSHALEAESRALVVRGPEGRRVSLEVDDTSELFDRPLVLPPEDKHVGNWQFTSQRFEVVPQHLFVYGLRFRGSRTVRLRQVTLHFRDGTSVTHNRWYDEENGNGRAFSKRRFSPLLEAWSEGQPEEAKVLAAIEILGSAQDNDYASSLRLRMTIPDPSVEKLVVERQMVADIQADWSERRTNAADLNAARNDLQRLCAALSQPFRVRATAIPR